MELVREAFHYQSRFAGSTMVFKIDFPVTEHPLFPSLVKDLALLSQTGFRVLIVPGAKEWLDTVLKENNIELRYNDSVRITSEAAMPFVQMAAFHSATRFITAFSGNRIDAVTGNFVRARGLGVINGVDMEHTGTVDKIYTDSIGRILGQGVVPIIPCLGWNSSGRPYNVPSDEIALQTALSLKATKLFIVSLSGGMKEYLNTYSKKSVNTGSFIRFTPQEAAELLETSPAEKGNKALKELTLAHKACIGGVERVHIINGGEEGSVIKELFSNLGTGTMIYADEYESIREIKSRDIPGILRIMEPLMQQGILLRRNAEDILGKKEDYAVFVIDGQIRACAALHDWGEGQAEIAAVATDPSYADMGLGSRIVTYLINKARKQGLKRVFALTISTRDWFESMGFREASVESLPGKKRSVYNYSRNSKVFALDLQAK